MAKAAIEFWTNPMSRGQIAHWMLKELGQPYETNWVAWGENRAAAYLAVNPMGKLPTIRHGGKIVTEAAAICLYLAEAFPQAGLKPQGAALADYYRWTLFAAGPVEHAVTSRAMGWQAPPERKGMLGFGDFEDTMNALDSLLSDRAFVCGDAFTAADVYVGSAVAWGLEFKTVPARPSFAAYAERVKAREAYQRTKAINGAKIAEMQKQG
jgi:glutathione S-transferase